MTNRTNWLALIAASVVGMFTGFLWYGFLFQKQWMEGNGITLDETQTKMFKNGIEQTDSSSMPMIVNTFGMFLYAFLMDWLLRRANATTWQSGATIGAVIGLILVSNITIGNMFAATSMNLSFVDGSYAFVLFTLMGAIIGGWQKKA
jgi:hypothetical protein